MRCRDLRYALRTLRRCPVFVCVGILALAFGIGVNTAVFSVVDAVLLKSLPAVEPDRLVMTVRTFLDRGGHYGPRYDDFVTWRDGSRSFESFTAVRNRTLVVADGERIDRVEGSEVSPSYFATLGVRPALGRAFTDAGLEAGEKVVLVSHAFWQRRLAGVEALPGVTRAAVSGTGVPMRSGMSTFEFYLQGHPKGLRPDVVVSAQEISAGYLGAGLIVLVALLVCALPARRNRGTPCGRSDGATLCQLPQPGVRLAEPRVGRLPPHLGKLSQWRNS